MLLKEALELLQEGKFVCREAWTLDDGYLSFLPGMKHVWKIVLQPSPNAGNYIFSYEDLVESDWKEFEIAKDAIDEAA